MNVKKPPMGRGLIDRADVTDTLVYVLKIYNHFPLSLVLFTNCEMISTATKTTFNNSKGGVSV